ncbi:helicase-like protein, putative [Medicago truncatula]|uniref:Helicase-like protein, putative n=1 Tax=Medicago truncatula TaxID=3880 RepID=G7KJX3_MEDTR|nr:helicase-like protein, putative [Medicago truncatula]
MCNGTRLLCRCLFKNMLNMDILAGSNAGKRFSVRLTFAITINKSQGQTISNVGIYLPRHVFSLGQLYVALSSGVSQNSTKVLIKEWKIEGEDGDFTENIVFKDILLSFENRTDQSNLTMNRRGNQFGWHVGSVMQSNWCEPA